MTRQIAVRLPDELVDFLDHLVQTGEASSRAAAVTHAIERERRRELAQQDAAILAHTEPDSDLNSLAEYAAHIPMNDLA
jgi:Arc/MetJ-type ribon-helix-helix transcriptional regulator